QPLVARLAVEVGEALQARHRDGAFAPLVRAEHRRLELLPRFRLDVLQRQLALPADVAYATPDFLAIAEGVTVLAHAAILPDTDAPSTHGPDQPRTQRRQHDAGRHRGRLGSQDVPAQPDHREPTGPFLVAPPAFGADENDWV